MQTDYKWTKLIYKLQAHYTLSLLSDMNTLVFYKESKSFLMCELPNFRTPNYTNDGVYIDFYKWSLTH